jgi:hypothetical protein
MSDEDEYQTAKIVAERLRDCLFDMAKRSMAPDKPEHKLRPDDLNALCNGRLFLENGFRDLTRIVDQSNLGKLGHEAIQQIIRGTALIGCVATYTDSQIDFIFCIKNRELAKRPRKRKVDPIVEFATRRLQRRPDIKNIEILAALTTEADRGADGSFWLSSDKKDFVYIDAVGNEKGRAISGVPSMISKLRKKVRRGDCR